MSDPNETVPIPEEIQEALREYPWWLVLLDGIAALGIGLLLFIAPAAATEALVVVFGWYWLITGLLALFSVIRDQTHRGWHLASGLLSVIAGIYIIGSPLVGTAILVGVATIMLGINGVLIGAADIGRAYHGGGWGIGVLGLLSIVIGAAIALDFPRFMGAMPWLWAVLATVAGVVGIVAAFQLRRAAPAK